MNGQDTFPRQNARTQRFTLGAPRDVSVSPDGRRVTFLRSGGAEDPINALWVLDALGGEERLVVDPASLHEDEDDDGDLPPAERARRERSRESAGGITSYSLDRDHRIAAAALGGHLVVGDLAAGSARRLAVPGPGIDPHPDPTGTRVAWVDGARLWVADLDDPATARVLVEEDDPDVRWGVAEFVAAEEMDRSRGFWWSPDGSALLVMRVDDAAVQRWWIADPSQPGVEPTAVAYPAAGTANADVSAWIVPLDGERVEVDWDRSTWPYVSHGSWDEHGPLLALHTRDQRAIEVRSVDAGTGATVPLWNHRDPAWAERLPGTPVRLADGRLVNGMATDGGTHLLVDSGPVTPEGLNVRGVCQAGDRELLITANPVDDATVADVWRWSDEGLECLTPGDGVHTAAGGGGTVVLRRVCLGEAGATVRVLGGPELHSHAAVPLVTPNPTLRHVGSRRLASVVLLPRDASDDSPLPVLLDPYGGPHAQRVVRAQAAHLTSQWFADQGFAVVVVDGRGTPGRGAAWERSVHGDLAGPVLEDQIDALHALAELEPRLDLSRVAIRGWSFGGYLAALAVLRRPDAVHAAVAGAPVTDWALYDTFYTERYLGTPERDADAYERSSLLSEAAALSRPLMLIHGLADDNVVSAHTLRFSSALLSAGRSHEVLPLTGVTHMASQEDVAENLLLLQLDFLRRSLPGARRVDVPPR